jgi:pimeloyl-ACP methyl ester carboxylesterase
MFADYDARAPFERAATYGFRLAKYTGPLPSAVTAAVALDTMHPGRRPHAPVGDDVFEVFRRQAAYDRTPLNVVVEATEQGDAWVKQTVTFEAAYGGERLRAFVFLPSGGSPPYQAVAYFPAGDAFQLRSSRDMSTAWVSLVVASGRAVLHPIYKGTYERGPVAPGPNAARDLRIAWSRDLGRALDYLETRTDIDHGRVAFYGVSAGAEAGVPLAALEPRVKVAVFQGTGLAVAVTPETDAANYAPRVRMPTLMINGRYDFETPHDAAQRPLFDLLGAPTADKRHVVLPTGHALPSEDVARELLPWLDRYLGPVRQASPARPR